MRSLRKLVSVAVLGAVLVTAAGCGVPADTDVVIDGRGQTTGPQGSSGSEQLPPGPEGANTVEEFVSRFLEAPAGDWDGAADRVRRFFDAQEQAGWEEPRTITVVRLDNGKPDIKPAPSSEVVLHVQQVGVLTSRGMLEPPTSQTKRYSFAVGPSNQSRGGLAVLDPPPVMLLTDTALAKWYEQRPVYFWDTDQRGLVPDLRYLPKAVPADDRPRLLIDWLLSGPADWLRPTVLELPKGTKQLGNAYRKDGRWIVDLNRAATDQSLNRLLAQLCWTLHRDFTAEVVLQIELQPRASGSYADYRNSNPAYRLRQAGEQGFAVAGGEIRNIKKWPTEPPETVPLVDPAVNKNVRSAAISDTHAALVRKEGGALRLWTGPDEKGQFTRTGLKADTMSRPVLSSGHDYGYVAADGRLYRLDLNKPAYSELAATGVTGKVTSLALSPDGRRLAVVAGGRPYLIAVGGGGDGSAAVARPVPTALAGLTAISWLGETKLAVTGTNRGKVVFASGTMDGAVMEINEPSELANLTVTGLVSFIENPDSQEGGPRLVEVDGTRAYEVFTYTLDYLKPEDLAGQETKRGTPAAPFFRE